MQANCVAGVEYEDLLVQEQAVTETGIVQRIICCATTVLLAGKSLPLLKTTSTKHPYPLVSVFKSLGYLAYILPRAHFNFLSPQNETN